MKVTILNGDTDGLFTQKVDFFVKRLNGNHTVNLFNIKDMDLHYCTGCWSCWWKTPGECATKDDADRVFRSVINSDIVLFASPLIAGFTSSTLKKITDRLIVLLHPYIELVNGECHHRKRYQNYPDMGLLLTKEHDTDTEDIDIVNDIYDRLAVNFHSKRRFTILIDNTLEMDRDVVNYFQLT